MSILELPETRNYILSNGRLDVVPRDEPFLTILDVGHGSCAILIEKDRTVVFDAGPKSGLLEFLLQNDVTTIDLMLLSHADADHIGGLIGILSTNSFTIKEVRLNTDSLKGSDIWEDLLYELDAQQKVKKLTFSPALTDGDNGRFDSAYVNIEILGPSAYLAAKGPGAKDYYGRRITTNSISAVIRLCYRGSPSVLLTGDVDHIGIDEIRRGGRILASPILVFPHHGGNTGNNMIEFSEMLYAEVKPKQVLFSIGRGKYGTPVPEVVKAARRINSEIRILCTELSEHCSSIAPKEDHTHISDVFALGRDDHHCCAGSITIRLEVGDAESPTWKKHQEFITACAPTALCRMKL
jgi:beta-lactamase superfamily II metal-dependent hydrolase